MTIARKPMMNRGPLEENCVVWNVWSRWKNFVNWGQSSSWIWTGRKVGKARFGREWCLIPDVTLQNKKPNPAKPTEKAVQGQDRKEVLVEYGGQGGPYFLSFREGVPERLPVVVERRLELSRDVGRKFLYNIRLPGTVQNEVLQDSEKHVTTASNSGFISCRHRANLFLKCEDVLALRDIGWLHACYCMGVRKEFVDCGEGWEDVKSAKYAFLWNYCVLGRQQKCSIVNIMCCKVGLFRWVKYQDQFLVLQMRPCGNCLPNYINEARYICGEEIFWNESNRIY